MGSARESLLVKREGDVRTVTTGKKYGGIALLYSINGDKILKLDS